MTLVSNAISDGAAQSADDIQENNNDIAEVLNGGLGSGNLSSGTTLVLVPTFMQTYSAWGGAAHTDREYAIFYPVRDGVIRYFFARVAASYVAETIDIAVNGTVVASFDVQPETLESFSDSVNIPYSAGDKITFLKDSNASSSWLTVYLERWEEGL